MLPRPLMAVSGLPKTSAQVRSVSSYLFITEIERGLGSRRFRSDRENKEYPCCLGQSGYWGAVMRDRVY